MAVRVERSGPRPVGAEEALAIGLANRVVPHGAARPAAEELARQLAERPQACLRADRLNAWTAGSLEEEFARGAEVLAEAAEGASRFAAGEGRHGE